MAHFIVEYSTNLEGFEPRALLAEIVQAAVATGIFPEAGCRARAHPCEDFFVADGRDTFALVHLQVRLGAGRSDSDKTQAQDALLEVLASHLRPWSDQQGVAISFEMLELPRHKANLNNIRDYLTGD